MYIEDSEVLMSVVTANYQAPQPFYELGPVAQPGEVKLKQAKVDGSVTSTARAVQLQGCIVSGDVTAYKAVHCKRSETKAVQSQFSAVKIQANSLVQGPVSAHKEVEVQGSRVQGNIDSNTSHVKVKGAAVIDGSISAGKSIEVQGSSIAGSLHSNSDEVKVSRGAQIQGDIDANKDVELSASRVHAAVQSASGSVKLKQGSVVDADVTAEQEVQIEGGRVLGSLRSTSDEVKVKGGAVVSASIHAQKKVSVEKSTVQGDLFSALDKVELRDSKCQGTSIKAHKELSIKRCTLAPNAILQSMSQNVEVEAPLFQTLKVAEVHAQKGVKLKNVSAEKVVSEQAAVKCQGGEFAQVISAGSPSLRNAKIGELVLLVRPGQALTLDLCGSEVQSLSVKVQAAVRPQPVGPSSALEDVRTQLVSHITVPRSWVSVFGGVVHGEIQKDETVDVDTSHLSRQLANVAV
jgi:hypothetical protein